MKLATILDKWAETLSKKAGEANTPLAESTDAFKAVTAYFAAQQKRGKKAADDEEPEPGGFSFEHGNEVLNGDSTGQRAAVHSRRNS